LCHITVALMAIQLPLAAPPLSSNASEVDRVADRVDLLLKCRNDYRWSFSAGTKDSGQSIPHHLMVKKVKIGHYFASVSYFVRLSTQVTHIQRSKCCFSYSGMYFILNDGPRSHSH
jgi:hypothetical protein